MNGEPENQQPTVGVAASKLDDSSSTFAPESTRVPNIDENNDEVVSRICGKLFLNIAIQNQGCIFLGVCVGCGKFSKIPLHFSPRRRKEKKIRKKKFRNM